MTYEIHEVEGIEHEDTIREFNRRSDLFPELKERHIVDGYWWLAYHGMIPVAFACVVTFDPMTDYAYYKRCLILPEHYGHGLQYRLMCAREIRCKQLGYTHIVSDCHKQNQFSIRNFRRSAFDLCEPEQLWAGPDSLYWIKKI